MTMKVPKTKWVSTNYTSERTLIMWITIESILFPMSEREILSHMILLGMLLIYY